MTKVYGIPNCDTVKKARAWLTEHGVSHQFHDFKKQGLSEGTLRAWCAQLGHEALVNRRGTTWRGLDAATQAQAATESGACSLMLAHTSAIKRPVVEWPDGTTTVGFDAAQWARLLPLK
ncbi:MAG: arsenate reductase [Serpentinimonas sp.]|nr:arsenate reductase [Serpentinimonas sp.]